MQERFVAAWVWQHTARAWLMGRLVRDEPGGLYAGDETTREFGARMRGVAADPEFDWTAAPVR